MTVVPPPRPMLPVRRRPWGIAIVVAVVLAAVAYLAIGGIGNALVYYVTPTELLDRGDVAIGETMRLGGQVQVGSVSGSATDLSFVLTDGESQVTVHSTVSPTRSFREGSGAVVQGALGGDGVFEATQLIVKHDENYVAPAPGETPAGGPFDPGE
jgi:cytochrome c-type biogenesis protein CcmE